jgi:hypothetical protein
MLNVTPSSKVAPLSEDFGPGMPRFSTDYNVDVEWGRVAIRPTKSTTQINLSVLASNFSEEICESSDCYRSSNFIQPVFGQIEIYELNKNKKPTLIEEWWDGGFAAANWQGFISGFGYSTVGELFSLGKKYRIQMTFQNPADDFAIYLSGLNQILINLNAMNGGTIGIDSIPGLQNLKQIGIFPSYIGTSVLKNDDQSVNLSQIIKGLSEIISSRAWPPYTERVCNTSQNSCMKIGKTKYFHRLIMEFTAGEMNYETGLLDLNDVNLQKESKIFKGYGMQSRGFPEIYCEVTE